VFISAYLDQYQFLLELFFEDYISKMFHDYPGSSHVLNTKRIEHEISTQHSSDNVDVGMDMLLTSTTRVS